MDYQNANTSAKVPFYMTYPMQNMYLMEMEYEKDMERMKALYPKEVQQILPYVEKRCDELEYEGSRIYDENPDQRMMADEVKRLYGEIQEALGEQADSGEMLRPVRSPGMSAMNQSDDLQGEASMQMMECGEQAEDGHCRFNFDPPEGLLPPELSEKQLESMERRRPHGPGGRRPPQPPPPPPRPGCDGWLCSMVGVLFQDEIYRRRCRHRRCHRWW